MGSVRKKGNRWYFSVELPAENGKRKRVEKAGGKTKKEAMRKMALFEAEFLKNGYKKESKLTFEELFNIWMRDYVELECKDNTISSYKRNARIHILPFLGNVRVVDIKARLLNSYFTSLKKEDYSYSLASTIRTIITSALNHAVFPMEIIDANPALSLKFPKFAKRGDEKEIIYLDELERILAVSTPRRRNFNNMCIFLFNTGMRIGEALALQWEDIDMDEKLIHIRHTVIYTQDNNDYKLDTPKTESSIRDIYFNSAVEKLLKEMRKNQIENKLKYGKYYINNDLVFTKENGAFMHRGLFVAGATWCKKKTGINFSMHSFRHTHATMLIEAGVPMKEVQMRLGHASIETTMNVYVQSSDSSKKNAVKMFDEYIKTSNI